jgi:hypothetical protein
MNANETPALSVVRSQGQSGRPTLSQLVGSSPQSKLSRCSVTSRGDGGFDRSATLQALASRHIV